MYFTKKEKKGFSTKSYLSKLSCFGKTTSAKSGAIIDKDIIAQSENTLSLFMFDISKRVKVTQIAKLQRKAKIQPSTVVANSIKLIL
jgi:hypothetical protein